MSVLAAVPLALVEPWPGGAIAAALFAISLVVGLVTVAYPALAAGPRPRFSKATALSAISIVVAMAALSVTGTEVAAGWLLAVWAFGTAALWVPDRIRREVARRRVIAGEGAATLVIGTGQAAEMVADRIRQNPDLGYRFLGFVDDEPLSNTRVLGGFADLAGLILDHRVAHVVIAFPRLSVEELIDLTHRVEHLGASVAIVPRLFQRFPRRPELEHVGSLALVGLNRTQPSERLLKLKHGVERAAAVALGIVLLPVIALTSLVVLVGLGRPLLFRQKRVGVNGHVFAIRKFRTMRDARTPDESDQARTPAVGRFLRATSLDELPQILNVIRGEMSFVGPRPERPELVSEFARSMPGYIRRLRVRPGITGWAQVHGLGRGAGRFDHQSLAERAEWDNHYIDNWSLRLEAETYARTLGALVRHRQDV